MFFLEPDIGSKALEEHILTTSRCTAGISVDDKKAYYIYSSVGIKVHLRVHLRHLWCLWAPIGGEIPYRGLSL